MWIAPLPLCAFDVFSLDKLLPPTNVQKRSVTNKAETTTATPFTSDHSSSTLLFHQLVQLISRFQSHIWIALYPTSIKSAYWNDIGQTVLFRFQKRKSAKPPAFSTLTSEDLRKSYDAKRPTVTYHASPECSISDDLVLKETYQAAIKHLEDIRDNVIDMEPHAIKQMNGSYRIVLDFNALSYSIDDISSLPVQSEVNSLLLYIGNDKGQAEKVWEELTMGTLAVRLRAVLEKDEEEEDGDGDDEEEEKGITKLRIEIENLLRKDIEDKLKMESSVKAKRENDKISPLINPSKETLSKLESIEKDLLSVKSTIYKLFNISDDVLILGCYNVCLNSFLNTSEISDASSLFFGSDERRQANLDWRNGHVPLSFHLISSDDDFQLPASCDFPEVTSIDRHDESHSTFSLKREKSTSAATSVIAHKLKTSTWSLSSPSLLLSPKNSHDPVFPFFFSSEPSSAYASLNLCARTKERPKKGKLILLATELLYYSTDLVVVLRIPYKRLLMAELPPIRSSFNIDRSKSINRDENSKVNDSLHSSFGRSRPSSLSSKSSSSIKSDTSHSTETSCSITSTIEKEDTFSFLPFQHEYLTQMLRAMDANTDQCDYSAIRRASLWILDDEQNLHEIRFSSTSTTSTSAIKDAYEAHALMSILGDICVRDVLVSLEEEKMQSLVSSSLFKYYKQSSTNERVRLCQITSDQHESDIGQGYPLDSLDKFSEFLLTQSLIRRFNLNVSEVTSNAQAIKSFPCVFYYYFSSYNAFLPLKGTIFLTAFSLCFEGEASLPEIVPCISFSNHLLHINFSSWYRNVEIEKRGLNPVRWSFPLADLQRIYVDVSLPNWHEQDVDIEFALLHSLKKDQVSDISWLSFDSKSCAMHPAIIISSCDTLVRILLQQKDQVEQVSVSKLHLNDEFPLKEKHRLNWSVLKSAFKKRNSHSYLREHLSKGTSTNYHVEAKDMAQIALRLMAEPMEDTLIVEIKKEIDDITLLERPLLSRAIAVLPLNDASANHYNAMVVHSKRLRDQIVNVRHSTAGNGGESLGGICPLKKARYWKYWSRSRFFLLDPSANISDYHTSSGYADLEMWVEGCNIQYYKALLKKVNVVRSLNCRHTKITNGSQYPRTESLSDEEVRLLPYLGHVLDEIEKDVPRSLPSLSVYQPSFADNKEKKELHPLNVLCRLLSAYALRTPKHGYAQATNMIASTLLLYLPEVTAFSHFVLLLERYLPPFTYSHSLAGTLVAQKVLTECVRCLMPDLFEHLFVTLKIGSLAVWSVPWFTSLFIHILPLLFHDEKDLPVADDDAKFQDGLVGMLLDWLWIEGADFGLCSTHDACGPHGSFGGGNRSLAVYMAMGLAILHETKEKLLASVDDDQAFHIIQLYTKSLSFPVASSSERGAPRCPSVEKAIYKRIEKLLYAARRIYFPWLVTPHPLYSSISFLPQDVLKFTNLDEMTIKYRRLACHRATESHLNGLFRNWTESAFCVGFPGVSPFSSSASTKLIHVNDVIKYCGLEETIRGSTDFSASFTSLFVNKNRPAIDGVSPLLISVYSSVDRLLRNRKSDTTTQLQHFIPYSTLTLGTTSKSSTKKTRIPFEVQCSPLTSGHFFSKNEFYNLLVDVKMPLWIPYDGSALREWLRREEDPVPGDQSMEHEPGLYKRLYSWYNNRSDLDYWRDLVPSLSSLRVIQHANPDLFIKPLPLSVSDELTKASNELPNSNVEYGVGCAALFHFISLIYLDHPITFSIFPTSYSASVGPCLSPPLLRLYLFFVLHDADCDGYLDRDDLGSMQDTFLWLDWKAATASTVNSKPTDLKLSSRSHSSSLTSHNPLPLAGEALEEHSPLSTSLPVTSFLDQSRPSSLPINPADMNKHICVTYSMTTPTNVRRISSLSGKRLGSSRWDNGLKALTQFVRVADALATSSYDPLQKSNRAGSCNDIDINSVAYPVDPFICSQIIQNRRNSTSSSSYRNPLASSLRQLSLFEEDPADSDVASTVESRQAEPSTAEKLSNQDTNLDFLFEDILETPETKEWKLSFDRFLFAVKSQRFLWSLFEQSVSVE